MEDLKNKIQNAAAAAADLPEVIRKEDGTIDIEKTSTGKDAKGRFIVPDAVLEKYYKELPEGVWNESGNSWVSNNGILRMPSEEVRRSGAEALNARNAQRRSNAEMIDIIYSRKAPEEIIEKLGLAADATVIEAINAAQALEAMKGNSKAYEVLRDTAGEKPTEKIDASIDCDPESLKMVERVAARMKTD